MISVLKKCLSFLCIPGSGKKILFPLLGFLCFLGCEDSQFYSLPESVQKHSSSSRGREAPVVFQNTQVQKTLHSQAPHSLDELHKDRPEYESGIGASQAYVPEKNPAPPQSLPLKEKKNPPPTQHVSEKKASPPPAPLSKTNNNSLKKKPAPPSAAPLKQAPVLTPSQQVPTPSTKTLKKPRTPGQKQKPVDILFIVSGSPLIDGFLNHIDQTFKGFTRALQPLNFEMLFIDSYQTDNDFFAVNMRHKNESAINRESFHRSFRPEKRLTKHTRFLEKVFINTLRIPRQTSWHRINRRTHRTAACTSDPNCHRGLRTQPLKTLQMSFHKNHFRKNATVVAVIVTDLRNGWEDLKRDNPPASAEDVLSHFDSFYEGEKDMLVYTISLVEGDSQCLGKAHRDLKKESAYASELRSLVKKTGGKNYSLCANSYVPLARQMVSDFQNPGD